ncbi:MAG: HAMP domain-containing histidine kinase [Anaerolineae bacterium]|nr:HAMP domain-containing histidine kinase [Anaerolineae bacterium]
MRKPLNEAPWPPFINATEDPKETLSRLVHEYTAPITTIQGCATLILKGKIDPQQAALTIHRLTEQMQVCQDAVLAYLQVRGKLEA